jgi:hypothetical protein
MFNGFRNNSIIKPREKRKKCEVIVEKTARGGIRKKVIGDCSPQELKALSGLEEIND